MTPPNTKPDAWTLLNLIGLLTVDEMLPLTEGRTAKEIFTYIGIDEATDERLTLLEKILIVRRSGREDYTFHVDDTVRELTGWDETRLQIAYQECRAEGWMKQNVDPIQN